MLVLTTWRIRRHIRNDILDGRARTPDPLASRELDSLQVEQLVSFMEHEFGVVFADEELSAETFESIPKLARIIEAKRKL